MRPVIPPPTTTTSASASSASLANCGNVADVDQYGVVSRLCGGHRDPLSTSRLGMRRMHGFRFRRPSLSEVHREPDHRGDRQKLALPVLERFEPEAGRRQVVGERWARLVMRHLVCRILRKAAERVSHPRDQEEQDERQAERMLVEPQDPAAAPDGPGRVRVVGEVARIGIDELLDARVVAIPAIPSESETSSTTRTRPSAGTRFPSSRRGPPTGDRWRDSRPSRRRPVHAALVRCCTRRTR